MTDESETSEFARLLKNSAMAAGVCVVLVTLCYWFVDQPVAFFVHDNGLSRYSILKWVTYAPPILQAWAPVVFVALMIRRAWGPFQRWERAVLAAFVALILADQFRIGLEYVFGRDWPETWIDNNQSLIGNGAYGFHLFHGNSAYGSFPSGHTASTVAFATVFWIAYPKWRWACVAACVVEAVGLIGMDYHFVGDVIGGAFVGGIVAAYTARRMAPHINVASRENV